MGTLIDLTGQRFGKLVALEKMESKSDGVTRWLCRCDCGNDHIVSYTNLFLFRIIHTKNYICQK